MDRQQLVKGRIEHNWCHQDQDRHLFFETFHTVSEFDSNMTLELLLVMSGAFRSVSQARKHHFSGPVPFGWSEHVANGHWVCVANVYDPDWADLGPFDPSHPEQ